MSEQTTPAIEPPPFDGTVSLVKSIVGFGVWVAIGLSPFLGNFHVRGFTAVIAMYPEDLQKWLIPLSGFFMGMIAVVVEFAGGRRLAQKEISRWFFGTTLLFTVSFVLLIVFYTRYVVRVDKTVVNDGLTDVVQISVITGTTTVPADRAPDCKCLPRQSARRCVSSNLNPNFIEDCFGADRIANARILLALVYLLVTGAFAAAVGLLLLQRRRRASANIAA